jgi:hypothetical protein
MRGIAKIIQGRLRQKVRGRHFVYDDAVAREHRRFDT